MRFHRLFFLLILFSTLLFGSQWNGHLFLWKIQKGTQTSYLFGTMHLADPALQELPWGLKKIIGRCDGGVYTEVPMTLSTQMKSAMLMLRSDRRSLKTLLPKPLYRRAQAYLRRLDPRLSVARYDRMKIWAFATTLSSLENQLKFPLLPALDTVIYRYAKNRHRPVGGIETVEEQIGALDSFTQKEQLLMLEGTLDSLEKEKHYALEMKRLYLHGNAAQLLSFIRRTTYAVPRYRSLEKKFMAHLLYDRNERMAKRVLARLQSHPKQCFFFAFGVMHFLGENSVIEELRRAGYRVTRVLHV